MALSRLQCPWHRIDLQLKPPIHLVYSNDLIPLRLNILGGQYGWLFPSIRWSDDACPLTRMVMRWNQLKWLHWPQFHIIFNCSYSCTPRCRLGYTSNPYIFIQVQDGLGTPLFLHSLQYKIYIYVHTQLCDIKTISCIIKYISPN